MRAAIRNGLALASVAAMLAPARTAAAQTIAITGGRVFPVSGPPIDNGTVLIRDGRVIAVGVDVPVPEGARRVDAAGKWVTPGLFDAFTQLGLVEVGQVRETREQSARGRDSIAAAFTVWEGLNPESVSLTPTRNEGVTTVAVIPTGGLIAGQAAVIDLVNGSVSDMIVRTRVAMVGEVGNPQAAGVNARGELIVKLRELLEDARAYARRRAQFERNQSREFAASRLDLEAMVPVVEGRLPLLLTVDKASDIESALKLASGYAVRIVIASGAEAWKVADKLAAAKVPVLTGAMNNIPTSFATLGARQDNAAMLRRAGVRVSIIGNAGGGDEEAFNVRNVKQEAGNAVAYGMSWDDALRSVTLSPAETFGVADRLGSLQPGREANVVVWSGDPFEFTTRAEHVFVRGVEAERPSRQDMLMERYKTPPGNFYTP